MKFYRSIDVNEGEKLGQVEKWLLEIEEVMRQTLRLIALKSNQDKAERIDWIRKYPNMVILSENMIKWTQVSEAAILNGHQALVENSQHLLS